MPCSRQRTGTGVPVSPCFKMAMMALSLYLEIFMKSLSAQLGLKFYFYMMLFLGGITIASHLRFFCLYNGYGFQYDLPANLGWGRLRQTTKLEGMETLSRTSRPPGFRTGVVISTYRQGVSQRNDHCWRRSTFDPRAGIRLTHVPALRTVASTGIAGF